MITHKLFGTLLLVGGLFLGAVELANPVQAVQTTDTDADADIDPTATQKGPCVPASSTFPTFNCGADGCGGLFGSCIDGSWTLITWNPGYCRGQEGGCTTYPDLKKKYVYVDCKCQPDGTTCAFNQYVLGSSTVSVTDCANVAATTP